MYWCPYSDLEVLDLYSLVLPSLGRIEIVIPTILWLASVGFIIHCLHPSITFQLCFRPDLLLDLWHGGPFPTRASLLDKLPCLFVSRLWVSYVVLAKPETNSTAINTKYLEMKWISYEKAHSWKVLFLNIHERKECLMKLALKYNEMNILKHSWKVVFLNIHECMKPKIIKIYVINAWTKAMENQRPQKAMVPKVISKDCCPHLYWFGLWAFVKVNKHLWM